MDDARAFLDARDFLLANRENYAAALHGFRPDEYFEEDFPELKAVTE